ncbi:MAG: fungal specific transcription factor domain-containing protein [Terriglobus roseus]|nr:fungal specific transcription factor domain-containing protein [Terriglobus roseus]
MIRRSDCQTVQQPDLSDTIDDVETQWRRAMDCEERKRLCQLCFLWDVQHAVLFSQSLCMSSFEIRSALPCSPAVWEAESPEEWQQHVSREPAPKLFLPVLKSYMSPSAPTQSHNLNALSRLLILHGLMSVSWDFTRRDQTSLGCGSLTGTDDWRARIGAAYDVWKADFDTYCLNISSSLNKAAYAHNPSIKSDFQRFTTSTLAIYHSCHIILNMEILDLQIYAGARHIIGRAVSRSDYERSRRKVRDWAQQKPATAGTTSSACTAAWHAAQLLRDGLINLDNWDVNNAFHYPWCLYLATLTCWAFHYGSRDDRPSTSNTAGPSSASNYDARSEDAVSMSMGMYGPAGATGTDDDNDAMLYDAKAEMNALVSGMTSGVPEGLWRIAGKYSTRGLTTVMAQHLSNVRWAVVHEGMKVLRGLMRRQEEL